MTILSLPPLERLDEALTRYGDPGVTRDGLEDAAVAGWLVKSSVPGRLRARHEVVRRAPMAGERLRLRLLRIDGINRYTYNIATSSILVTYDPAMLTCDELLRILTTMLDDDWDELVADDGRALPDSYEMERRFSLSTANLGMQLVASRIPQLRLLAVFGTTAAVSPVFFSAFRAIFIERKVRVDILDAIVIFMLMLNGWYLAASTMAWLLVFADTVLESASRSSRELISRLFGKQSRHAWLLRDGEELEYPVSALTVGDRIVVRTGEQVPVDGVVYEGDALIDQHFLSGEHVPVDRGAGESVFGMTNVLEGRVVVEVRETADTSSAAKIVRIIEETMQHRVRLQYLSEKFADRMVLPTLGIGGLGYVLAGTPAMIAIINADYGTGIRVACPLALVASLSVAARHGIVIKNGTVLETLKDIDAVIFDKTGTLTQDVPEVAGIHTYDDNLSEEELLGYAACAERKYSHPIARAVLRRAAELDVPLPRAEESTYHIGFGLQVEVDGRVLKVGSRRFIELAGIEIPPDAAADLDGIAAAGRSAVLVALDLQLAGVIELRGTERKEAAALIASLKGRRHIKEIALVSGDHRSATKAIAEKLGIEHYHAEMLPEQKAKYVHDLQRRGWKVAMVGDGINDSMALSSADCSISLRGAADVAVDVADVVFMDGDLAKFELLFELSENLSRNVRRSFAMAIVPNTILIIGALGGWFGIRASMVLNNAFNVMAAMNGLLPYWSVVGDEKRSSQ
jgi:heavy metal translocating P-type ATPase